MARQRKRGTQAADETGAASQAPDKIPKKQKRYRTAGLLPRIRAPVDRAAADKFLLERPADAHDPAIVAATGSRPSWSLVSAQTGVDIGVQRTVRVKVVR